MWQKFIFIGLMLLLGFSTAYAEDNFNSVL